MESGNGAHKALSLRAAELTALLIESIHKSRRLVKDIVILMHKRIPNLNKKITSLLGKFPPKSLDIAKRLSDLSPLERMAEIRGQLAAEMPLECGKPRSQATRERDRQKGAAR